MTVTRHNPAGLADMQGLITHAVVAGGLIHLSGQVAMDAAGKLVGAGDHVAQVAQIVHNIDVALAAAGAGRADVVKETIYVVDYSPALLAPMITLLRAGVPHAPASTLVVVPALFAPGYLVEIEVVASGGAFA
jgi:enamine deaminase RidA (YjgF/YER057c/UK114 family)